MDTFKKILFFADGAKGEKAALQRCIELAQRNGAKLTVMDVVAAVASNDKRLQPAISRLQKTLVKERKVVLEALVADANSLSKAPSKPGTKPTAIKINVTPGKDYIEVIRAVLKQGFDLLVKSANKHNVLTSTLLGNTDLSLLRKCPCPVWIIKPGRKKKIEQVLAAVDMAEEPEAQQLATRVVAISALVAAREKADLHVLNAWHPAFEPHMRTMIAQDEYDRMMQMLKDKTSTNLHKLVAATAELGASQNFTEHLEKGDPENVINSFVKSKNIDLLVMGTMSRSGIPGFLIGNTAERVLDNVDCSVLTLKPQGFKTPVGPAE
jgi:universal stress protein E